jgi:FKBP-type peptidyl-prolyl cis-trans isomerase 2
MRTVRQGDRVCVHFVKRSQRGEVISSRGQAPLELEVGTANRRLPGLGLALVGMSEGQQVVVTVPAHLAYGPPGPERLRRVARSRFTPEQDLSVGRWVRVMARNGRRRLVRVVEVHETSVVVDTNHRWAGQDVVLEVEVLSIKAPAPGGTARPQAAADDLLS